MKKLYENCVGQYNFEIEDIEKDIYIINDAEEIKEKKKGLPSITKILNMLHPEFDKIGTAKKMVEKYYDDPTSKYYRMSEQDILDLWNLKSQGGLLLGRMLDDMMQSFTADPVHYMATDADSINLDEYISVKENTAIPDKFLSFIDPDDMLRKANNFVAFYRQLYNHSKKNGYVNIIAGSEVDTINLKYGYKGRLDSLWYFKNIEDSNKDFLMLVDYKNTKDLTVNNRWGEHMYGPLSIYPDCDLNVYTMQLYMYKNALVNTYHIPEDKIVPRVLNITKDKCKFYTPYIPYSDKLIEEVMTFANEKLNKNL